MTSSSRTSVILFPVFLHDAECDVVEDEREDEQDEAELWETVASPDGDKKVDALLQLSYNASSRNDYREQLAFCETARDVYEGLGEIASDMKLAHIYFGIGDSLRHLNHSAEGAKALAKSVALYEEIGAEDSLHVLKEEGDAWYEAKEYQKSYEAYRKAIESANPDSFIAMYQFYVQKRG